MTPEPRPVTREDVKKFVDHCVILRAFWIHYGARRVVPPAYWTTRKMRLELEPEPHRHQPGRV